MFEGLFARLVVWLVIVKARGGTWGGTWIAQRTAPPTSSNPHKARPQK